MARELTPAAAFGAYVAALALVFVTALALGRAVGPVGSSGSDDGVSRRGEPTHGMTVTERR